MKRRLFALLLALAMVLTLLPQKALPVSAETAEAVEVSADEKGLTGTQLKAQIRATYSAALQLAGVSSFNGYCAAYVNWQMVALGIDKKKVGVGSGKNEFDHYTVIIVSAYSVSL